MARHESREPAAAFRHFAAQAIEHNADRSSLRPRGASGLPAGCCGQASWTKPGWSWISVSSSLLEGYDEPEILRSSSRQFCLTSAEAGHVLQLVSKQNYQHPIGCQPNFETLLY